LGDPVSGKGVAKILKPDIVMSIVVTVDTGFFPDEAKSLLERGQLHRITPFINEEMIISYTTAHHCLRTPPQVVSEHLGHLSPKRDNTAFIELRFPDKGQPVLKIDVIHN
jgi:hypothetical protein